MQNVLVLIAARHRQPLDRSTADAAIDAMRSAGARVGAQRWLAPGEAVDLPFDGDSACTRDVVAHLFRGEPIDVVTVPAAGRRKRLLIADMDSTILENETLDELAAFAGVGERVAAITARSMRGEIDFAGALRERVAMLEGLDAGALERTAEGLRVMPGAAALIATMRAGGAYTALVSGGFRYFTGLICDRLGFDHHESNELIVADGRLTGRVGEPIVDRDGKLRALERLAAKQGIPLSDCLAVGDGANDLAMIGAAGLGVAYHAKPVVAAAADARLDHTDLTALLYIQGYTESELIDRNRPSRTAQNL